MIAAGCGIAMLIAGGLEAASGPVRAVGIENQYADVIAQIGGKDVEVSAIETDPNTDPHSFEVSPSVARQIGGAALVVENGLGYDGWAAKIVEATPNSGRKVIDVQHLLGLPDSTPNPHLWYDPRTMPAVAAAVATELTSLLPDDAAYFEANLKAFNASLQPWMAAIAAFKAAHPRTPVAVTEPVADYLLRALGAEIRTPSSLESAVMNGNDPAPQDVSTQNGLLSGGAVKIFVYNQQVTDTLTGAFLDAARTGKVPVVGVYETMPTPGFTYQSWMLAETAALEKAVADGTSTARLVAGK